MAWGADVFNTFNVGYERGAQMKERARKNKIAEILSQAYQAPTEAVPFQTDEEQLFGLPALQGNVAQEAIPGGFDSQNALAKLYQGGFGPEAIAFEQQMQDRELGGLLKRAQVERALRGDWGSPQAVIGADGKEQLVQFDKSGNMRTVPGLRPRPQQPLVNLDMSGKQAFSKELAQEQAKIYGESQKAAADAGDVLSSLDQLEAILPEVNTGILAPAEKLAGAAIEAVGGKAGKFGLSDPAKAEQFEAVSNKLALMARQGMPGAMSDADRQFLVNSVANLGKRPEANQEIIANFRKAAQRVQEKAIAQDRWVQQNGSLTGFNESWNKYVRENPLFPKTTKKGALVPGKTIEDGHIYLGGDPANPKSWKKLSR